MGGISKSLLVFDVIFFLCSIFLFLDFLMLLVFVGTQTEREEKVSLELSEEILQSMEVGMAFKDYVSNSTITFSVLILD